jgi:hypothetical protein
MTIPFVGRFVDMPVFPGVKPHGQHHLAKIGFVDRRKTLVVVTVDENGVPTSTLPFLDGEQGAVPLKRGNGGNNS